MNVPSPLKMVSNHISSALTLLSNRENPDYCNSIKESISAVEAAATLIVGKQKADLKEALKELEKNGAIHAALKNAFISMYGYTSDENGIRHCMLEESEVDFVDAKYMLVACSAFVNYLIMKAGKADLPIGK